MVDGTLHHDLILDPLTVCIKRNSGTDKRGKSQDESVNFEEEAKRIQKKIDWISRQIRETKILLHKQNQDLQKAIKEQEELRKK